MNRNERHNKPSRYKVIPNIQSVRKWRTYWDMHGLFSKFKYNKMIDTRELRIGNLFYDRGGKVLRLDYWDGDKLAMRQFMSGREVHPFTEYPDYAEPIPLTPEWLERLGFEKDGNQYALNEHIWIQAEDNDWNDPCLEVFIRVNPNNGIHDELYQKVYIGIVDPFVHSIQNYIFALRVEELKIND